MPIPVPYANTYLTHMSILIPAHTLYKQLWKHSVNKGIEQREKIQKSCKKKHKWCKKMLNSAKVCRINPKERKIVQG